MKKLYYGAAYYPELWEQDVINKDIELMVQAGINVVRMGEFSWSTLETHPDHFNIDFFSAVINQLNQKGIQTILCTPTATPPIWLSHNHRDRMIVDSEGTIMSHGGRQHVCTNNATMRERSQIIIEKMAKEYGNMPGVIAWQLDNELKGNVSECYCESCKILWHDWLQKRYITIDNLNAQWGTHIWSQYYDLFEQVPQPFKTPMGHNPSLVTAYRRFSRDLAANFLNEQADVIRKFSKLPITHNSSLNHFIDNEKSFEPLDFVSFDHYSTSHDYMKMLSWLDTFKTLKHDTPFWVMETAPTFSGSIYGYQTIHENGYILAEVAAAYALGAEGFNYWLWRQQRTGVELTHGHVVSSWGEPGVGFENVVAAGKLRKKLEDVFSMTHPMSAEIAVTYSDTARLFFMTEPFESKGFDYTDEMMYWYERVLQCGLHRDFIFEQHPLDRYKILMSPYMPYLSESYIEQAVDFVENGGVWIVGPLTGIRTCEHTVHTDAALSKLEAIAGIKVVFHYPMTASGAMGKAFDSIVPLSLWSSALECIEAKEIGKIEGGLTPGLSFITECTRGLGKVVLLGSMPTGEEGKKMINQLIRHYAIEVGINMYDTSLGTIVIPRQGDGIEQWVVINMDGKGGTVTIPYPYFDSFSQVHHDCGMIKIMPYECKVINIMRN